MNDISLILGFFDGVHAGHQDVINSAIEADCSEAILLTFSSSPAEFFGISTKYIYPREISYKIMKKLGVHRIIEQDFEELQQISAQDYLQSIIQKYSPQVIATGFNHTFGHNRGGNADLLRKYQSQYNYKYICAEPHKINNEIVSSTRIKELLTKGDMTKASEYLTRYFSIEGEVVTGAQLGRQIGYPTANIEYPNNIVKIPHGVYKARVLNRTAVLNWGKKPTVGLDKEIIEVHIPNFNGNLYGKKLNVEVIKKIRDEQKFSDINKLKDQIEKDVQFCLE
jgi:riboflavin kinase/FMN adenylyltransferase